MRTISRIKKKKKKQNRTKYIILLLIGIAIATIILILAKGKYVLDDNTLHIQNSERFYFESDLLTLSEETEYIYTDWDTSQEYYSINLNVKNYVDELRYNNLPTTYEINVTNQSNVNEQETKIYIDGIETSTGTIEENGCNLNSIEIKVKSIDDSNMEFKVEINSTSPYTKKIGANFIIQPKIEEEPYLYNIINNEDADYDRLLIQTNGFSGLLRIAYNTEKVLSPDMSSVMLQDASNGSIADSNYRYIEVNLEENTNYQIDFIKNNRNVTLTVGDSIENYDIAVGY